MADKDGWNKLPLRIDSIKMDPRLQVRVKGTDEEHVENLLNALQNGEKLGRPTVWTIENPPGYPPGTYNFATDGNHTIETHIADGRKTIPCRVKRGTWAEAIVAAATANQDQKGKSLTLADRKRSVAMLLEVHGDDSAEPWSDPKIAELSGMSRSYVLGQRQATQRSTTTGRTEAASSPDGDTQTKLQPATVTGTKPAERMGRDGKTRHVAKRSSPADVSLSTVEKNGLIDAADYVWAALRSANLTTVGEAIEHIRNGGHCGLKPTDAADIVSELQRLVGTAPPSVATEYVKSGDPVFDFKRFDTHFGVVRRSIVDVLKVRPELSAECGELEVHLGAFLKVWQSVQQKFTRTQQEVK